MPPLSPEQEQFWQENGYVVVPGVVPQPLLDAVVETIEAFLGKDLADPADWYKAPMYPGGIINMHSQQALWDTRQHPRLHEAFSQVWGTEKLAVSVDRANMNPPSSAEWDNEGTIHWDMDSTVRPLPFNVQGVLCLSDTEADQGGFCCVPGFHRRLEEWARTQPADRPPSTPDTTGMEIRHIPAKAGDLIVWHRSLPHGNSRNRTGTPRLCQYITMGPAATDRAPAPMPLARTRREVLADALGVPEGLAEQWLREQREAERVVVRADSVAEYGPVPRLIRLEKNGDALYLNKIWGRIVDAQTVEARRDHAERLKLPIAGPTPDSAEAVRQAVGRVPAPRFAPRLSQAQLDRLPGLLAAGPAGTDEPFWDEDSATRLLADEFGLEIDTREAELTPLGRKLAGVEAW